MIQQALFDCSGYDEVDELSGDSLSENNKSGTIAEMKLATEAMKHDYMVYFPVGHSTKTDLILKKQGKRPITVQVKKATYQHDGGSYKVMVGSSKPSCPLEERITACDTPSTGWVSSTSSRHTYRTATVSTSRS